MFVYIMWQGGPSETVSPPRTTENTGTIGQQSGDIPQTTSEQRRPRQRWVSKLYRRKSRVSFSINL
jgi:hypothetical protein